MRNRKRYAINFYFSVVDAQHIPFPAGPLVDYILSMTFILVYVQQGRLAQLADELTRAVEQEILSRGAVHITKNAGVFIAR